MRTFCKSLAALLLLVLAVWTIRSGDAPAGRGSLSATPLTQPAPGDAAWRLSALWDDGKAEFCAYRVNWARYGHHFPGRALLVLVKEPWAPDLDVKADEVRRDGFEVLKLNHVRDVPTGIYTYHQMASVFVRRDDGSLCKIAATSSEACGISTAEMVDGRLETRSYFDRQGDRSAPYPAGALPEDGLPLFLRSYVAGPPPPALSVFPSLLQSRFPELVPVTYRVEKKSVTQGVELRLTAGTSALAYVFEAQPPHRLVRFEREDGTVYELAKCDRLPYWEMHDPGGEAWLPPEVR